MCTLKSLIRNFAHPKGSIAEGYIANECMTLCSRYLKDMETKFNRLECNYNSIIDDLGNGIQIFSYLGQSLGAARLCYLDQDELEKDHIYILKNCDEVQPFLQ